MKVKYAEFTNDSLLIFLILFFHLSLWNEQESWTNLFPIEYTFRFFLKDRLTLF